MTHYNITINDELAAVVDRLMAERKYANRSEFFRDLIRRFYLENEDHVIEELHPDDPDLSLIQNRSKDAEFIALDKLLQSDV